MPTIRRHITETITAGETKRVERVAYVAKDGREFDTPQAAYRHDIQAELIRALGPVIELEPTTQDYWIDTGHDVWMRDQAMLKGFERAVNQMLDRPEEAIRLLELWRTNKDL